MPKKVLFIDDDEVLGRVVGRLLEYDAGQFEVTRATSGSEGLAKAREIQPDVIILDIMLSGENGWDTAEKLKKDESTQRIPIIVASGAGSMFDEKPYIARSLIAEYVRKPYDVKMLVEAIDRTT